MEPLDRANRILIVIAPSGMNELQTRESHWGQQSAAGSSAIGVGRRIGRRVIDKYAAQDRMALTARPREHGGMPLARVLIWLLLTSQTLQANSDAAAEAASSEFSPHDPCAAEAPSNQVQ